MELPEIRKRIDEIDAALCEGFVERMDIATEVARAKMAMGKKIYDPGRERDKLYSIAKSVPERYESQMVSLFSLLMTMSKEEQARFIAQATGTSRADRSHETFEKLDVHFPTTATVACQGVEGAYSQIAASKLFEIPKISFFSAFEGVFKAVDEGFCEFGVLPIENSTAGSVNAVYDLLAQYGFSIVRSLRLKVDHNLLAKPGTRIEDIREVISHEQALAQSAGFLEGLGVQTKVVENTARAAEMVAESDRVGLACLSSRDCAPLYGLDVIASDVQDNDNNYTRFVVISKTPRIYPGATKSSLMLTLKSEPGSLFRVLERFYAQNINLVKLESRPIPGRDNEFAFYFDLDCPAGTRDLDLLLDSLDEVCATFTYFGSYTEVL